MTERVALISGASGGIGSCVARLLVENGWHLSLGARDAAALQKAFPEAQVVRHDAMAGDEDDWVAQAKQHYGRIDAVICAAGVLVADDVVHISDEAFGHMWEVNVNSPRRLVRAAWSNLINCGAGRIVTLVSLSGKRVRSAPSASYAVSKHAALALTHGFRHEGWQHGIRATSICPGRVRTEMTRAVTDLTPEEMTQPEDVAAMVRLALDMPNTAALAEMTVNCELEDQF
ncbi:SDR family NAD(P)-dependent oxidoreductase [Sulfitobacter aestuarii]|uniref:SDR family NAD(P)-dependent oxidoreductase n=1 Tax=Sulfitobacter aestuarii TaxID=2161676 RepID=A0ABW5U8K9_9RHOB